MGFTEKIGDIVILATPRLDALIKRVRYCHDVATWIFGTRSPMENLARRNLLGAKREGA